MIVAGIISEYNPFHLGHLGHFEKTRAALGGDCAIVCVMSGNYVQRGEPAIFGKHPRAEAAVRCGADLVIELPTPYALSSAEGFARGGVFLLNGLGVCDAISFGSEYGKLEPLAQGAKAVVSREADELILEWLGKGLSYAAARQKAADALMGSGSEVFRSPNNLLGIEYLKALAKYNSKLTPVTVTRTGGEHDGDSGYSASRLRKILYEGGLPWDDMPGQASGIFKKEMQEGRGPVCIKGLEPAVLSRLRMIWDFSLLPGVSEGLDRRFAKFAAAEPTVEQVQEKIKTKRYAMSRIRRMIMCACLGITEQDSAAPPPYIRVLAMNETG
ncbi:MAG: nucleotidyltransferase family protein, partial [Oscillospiraceae bacterium]|nr:nucleotidyltransferase family protein [Oscillospiraceae bacterium]